MSEVSLHDAIKGFEKAVVNAANSTGVPPEVVAMCLSRLAQDYDRVASSRPTMIAVPAKKEDNPNGKKGND